jgi:beta-lactam-binding protein with PASTA domain
VKRRGGFARRVVPFLATATGGLLSAYLLVAFVVFPHRADASDRPVPNVTGLAYADAAARLEQAGFKAARGEQRYQATAPKGSVLAQTPEPGTVEPQGTAVVLDLSRGQRMGDVPRLVGLTQQDAEAAIANAGLDVGEVTSIENGAPRGQVISSSPAAGKSVPMPSPVNLTVSSGPAMVTVPDVMGQDYHQARSLLTQLGFTVGHVDTDTSRHFTPNTVIGQSPAANSHAPAGTTISLTISRAP